MDDILQKANLKFGGYIYKILVACLTHKVYNNKCPNILKDLAVETVSEITLGLAWPTTNFGKNSFQYRAALIRNKLPLSTASQENYGTF